MRQSALFRMGMLAAVLLPASGAFAATVPFSDSFDSYPASSGGTTLNWDAPSTTPWDTSNGTVDLIYDNNGTGAVTDYGIDCYGGSGGGGGCIDLDGSTGDSGVLHTLSTDPFTFKAGSTYTLSAYVSGNQRGGTSDDVLFGIRAPGSSDVFNVLAGKLIEDVASNAAFTLYTVVFKPTQDVLGELFFSNVGGRDNIGPILDNVSLTAVPIPAAGWLLISGLVGLVGVARRRQNGSIAPVAAT